MTVLIIPPPTCSLLADVNSTSWTGADQFDYLTETFIEPTIFSIGNFFL